MIIYHIFTPNRLHLVPQILTSFDKLIEADQIYVLLKCNNECRIVYNDIQLRIRGQIVYANSNKEVCKLVKNKKSIVLMHSILPYCTLQLMIHNYKNVNAVCWGSGLKLSSLKNILYYPFKLLLYNYYSSIITLMTPDKKILERIYFVRKVSVIPYIGERERLIKDITLTNVPNNRIYIGNNPSCLSSYYEVASSLLFKFRNYINVDFMFNYSFDYTKQYKALEDLCKKSYPCYRLNKEFYDIDSYLHYMNQCSIFICAEMRQTGLGAIYTCLYLGKKVFLRGNNLSWIKSLGCIVYSIDSLSSMSYKDFIQPLSNEERIINRSIMEKLDNIETKIKEWNNYFGTLC